MRLYATFVLASSLLISSCVSYESAVRKAWLLPPDECSEAITAAGIRRQAWDSMPSPGEEAENKIPCYKDRPGQEALYKMYQEDATNPQFRPAGWSGPVAIASTQPWVPTSESNLQKEKIESEPEALSSENATSNNPPLNSSPPGNCASYVVFPAHTVNTGLRGSYRAVINPVRFEVSRKVISDPEELKKRISAFQNFYENNVLWDSYLNVIEDVDGKDSMYRDESATYPYDTPEVFTEKHAAEPGKSAMSIKPFLDNALCWAGLSEAKTRSVASERKDWSDYPAVKTATGCLSADKSDPSLLKNGCKDSIEVHACTENVEDNESCSAEGRRAWKEWRSDTGIPKGWGIATSRRIRPGESFLKEDSVAACPRGSTIAIQYSLSNELQNHRCIMVPGQREED